MKDLITSVSVKPFPTPNFCLVKLGVSAEEISIPLDEMSDLALSNLCDEFRKKVFEKAKKQDPMVTRIRNAVAAQYVIDEMFSGIRK